ncbi:hypothetical protein Syun_017922 [Stephania yunnanensis]|uniref:Aldehyde dehydrogenase domain-containing protein n=1 Tax=Stephania yunnanensis TaxID=152371 RepID=A0AAP0IRZ5_9MAGN
MNRRVDWASMILAELAMEAGLPNGVLNIVHGTNDTVNNICDDEDIKAISFVGSNTKIYFRTYELCLMQAMFEDCLDGNASSSSKKAGIIDKLACHVQFDLKGKSESLKIDRKGGGYKGGRFWPHLVACIFMQEQSKRGKRVQCNMGAKNHAIIMPDASIDATLNSLVLLGFGARGQICMALSVAVFVGDSRPWLALMFQFRSIAILLIYGIEGILCSDLNFYG